MLAQPIRTHRLFSRRLTVLASRLVEKKGAPAAVEMSVRGFRALSHFLPHGEPARFELSDCNFIEESWKGLGPTSYRSTESTQPR
jgi:hypothetical protein